MKWILSDTLDYNENVERMKKSLMELEKDFLLVRVNKDLTLTVMDNQDRLPLLIDFDIAKWIGSDSVMVYGTKGLSKVTEEKKWFPGTFASDRFEFDHIKTFVGDDLLNQIFEVGLLADLECKEEHVFLRPSGNTKLFTGRVVTKEVLEEWKRRDTNPESPYKKETLVMSDVKEIIEEYRFFIVDDKVVSGSSYMVNGYYNIEKEISVELLSYVNRMVKKTKLEKAYVIDIALTSEGFKIIEYNNINTSGLYGCDEKKIIHTLDKLSV